ncbi:MAG: DUF4097 family beta strand repeat protein [Clostridiales bacterium]|nr:DUF4097 family beta strand repeat protein [Clostridiales bacterium]
MNLINNTYYTYENADKYTAGDREITETIDSINIDYVSGDVRLIGSDTDEVTITETANKELDDEQMVHTWVDGSTLYVRFCASSKSIDLNNIEKELEIVVPESQLLDTLLVEISSGSFYCSDITSGDINVSSSSGAIEVNGSADNINLEASSGSVYLNQERESENISINTSSGSITAEIIATDKLDIDASSGDVTVYLPEDADVTANVETSSGEFNYELSFSRIDGAYVSGDGSSVMNINTSSGDVSLLAR